MRKKWLSRFLAAALVVGSLGVYMPVNAETVQSVEQQADIDGEADSKAGDTEDGQEFIPGQAIVCYKADASVVSTTGGSAQEAKKQASAKKDAEQTLEKDSAVDDAEALMVASDVSNVLEWLFSAAAGIRPDPVQGGWRRFRLRPYPDRRLGSCSASYRSDFGTIKSAWRYAEDGRITWRFSIPKGSTALVTGMDGTTREYQAGDYELKY